MSTHCDSMIEWPDGKTQERNNVAWDIVDFTVFSAMILGVGVAYALMKRNSDDRSYRLAIGVALAAAFILVWVNGAVGIIGDESNDANMMFFGVLAVGVVGAFIARFKPYGMSYTLYSMAAAQAAVAAIAMIGDSGSSAPDWPMDTLVLTGLFIALWLLSAWMFRKAATATTDPDCQADSGIKS